MNNHNLAFIGALLLLVSIAFGALGAHALAEILTENRLKGFLTANQYLSIHGLAFLILAFFPVQIKRAGQIIFAGLMLFSGSIFLLITLGHLNFEFPKMLALITPIGGLLMLVGWAVLAFKIWQLKK